MVQAELEVVIKARDLLSSQIEKATGNVKRSINRNVKEPAKGAELAVRQIRRAFLALGGLVVLRRLSRGVTEFARSLSDAAKTAEELENRFQIAFGEGVKQAEAFAEAVKETTGRGILDTKETQTAFQVLFTGFGVAREQAQLLSESATQLAIDFGSFFDQAPSVAQQSLISGLVGETEVLRRRFNVAVNDILLRQEAARLGFLDLGEAIDPAARAIVTLSLAARQQSAAIGDAERTIDSFANTIVNIESQVRDLRAELGQELNDELLRLINNLGGVQGVVDLVRLGFSAIQSVITSFVGFLATEGTQAITGFLLAVKGLADIAPGFDELERSLGAVLDAPIFKAAQLRLEIQKVQQEYDALSGVAGSAGLPDPSTFGVSGPTIDFERELLAEELARLQAELAEVDALVPQVGEKIRQAFGAAGSDSPTARLREELAEIKRELDTFNIPALEGLGASSETIAVLDEFGIRAAFNTEQAEDLAQVLQNAVVIAFKDTGDAADGAGESLSAMEQRIAAAVDEYNKSERVQRANIEAATGYSSALEAVEKASGKFTLSLREQRQQLVAQRDAALAALTQYAELGDIQDPQLTQAIEAVNRAFRDQVAGLKEVTSENIVTRIEVNRLTEAVKDFIRSGDEVSNVFEAFIRGGQRLGESVISANRAVAASKDVAKSQAEAAKEVNRTSSAVQGGLVSAFDELTPSIERSDNALQNFLATLLEVVQRAALSQLVGNLFSGFGTEDPGAGAGSLAGAQGSVIGGGIGALAGAIGAGGSGAGTKSFQPPFAASASGGTQLTAQAASGGLRSVVNHYYTQTLQASALDAASFADFLARSENRSAVSDVFQARLLEDTTLRHTLDPEYTV